MAKINVEPEICEICLMDKMVMFAICGYEK